MTTATTIPQPDGIYQVGGTQPLATLQDVLGEMELLTTLLARLQQSMMVNLEGDQHDLQRVCEQGAITLGLAVQKFDQLVALAYRLRRPGTRLAPGRGPWPSR